MATASEVTVTWREFGRLALPIVLLFVTSRLVVQVDVIMLAPLGQEAVAAFGVPARVMLIDLIVALALGPVIAVLVARAQATRSQLVHHSLSAAFYVGLFLTAAGLVVYPIVVQATVEHDAVRALARDAIFWLTLAIPIRLTQFVGTMILLGSGRGRELIPVLGASFFLKIALNWIFIYPLALGFRGCYIATLVTSVIELVWVLRLISATYPGVTRAFAPPSLGWVSRLLMRAGPEWGRLVVFQGIGFFVLLLLGRRSEWITQLGVYAVAVEMQALITMPFIASMRAAAISLAPRTGSAPSLYRSMRHVLIGGVCVSVVVGLLFAYTVPSLGAAAYRFGDPAIRWWYPFAVMFGLMLPLSFANSIQRGIWQSRGRFGLVFAVDAIALWGGFLPLFYLGVSRNHPWLAWSGIVIAEGAVTSLLLLALWFGRRYPRRVAMPEGQPG